MKTPHEFAMELLKPVAAPTPPAQEDEPVAVVTVTSYYEPGYASIKVDHKIDVGTKLYLRPADDKLRKAAEEIIKIWDGKGRTDMYGRAIENLRAALERNPTPSSTDTQFPA